MTEEQVRAIVEVEVSKQVEALKQSTERQFSVLLNAVCALGERLTGEQMRIICITESGKVTMWHGTPNRVHWIKSPAEAGVRTGHLQG